MKLLLSFIFFTSLIFANTINVSERSISNDEFKVVNDKKIFNPVRTRQNVFLSYENNPSNIVVNQQFSVKVKAIVTTQNFDEIKNTIESQKNIKVLNLDENWTKKDDYIYYKTFYLRALKSNAIFPSIYFKLYKNKKLIASQKFPDVKLNIINLHADKYFSNIVADSLDIIKIKTTKFDEEKLMVVLEIVAKNANLKDFKLSWVVRDGIDSYVDNFPISKIYYYAIIPKYTNKFIFKYFNIKQNRFIKKSIDIVLKDENISTQSDLNPQDSSFNLYKNIAYGALAIVLLLIFFKRKRIVYLLFFIVLIVLFFSNMNPLRNVKILKNSKVFILPTKNTTIFYITPKEINAQKLNTRGDYIKIILPNSKIGWIKEENVINN